MPVTIRSAYNEPEVIRKLFTEYTDMLCRMDGDFANYLQVQDYSHELENPGEKYALPGGRLYLVEVDNQAVGCVALHRLNETECEIKRLYIRPPFRGQGLARALVRRVIASAQDIGYKFMLLDTFPNLEAAIRLYESEGFYRVPRYNDNPMDSMVYLKLDLDGYQQGCHRSL